MFGDILSDEASEIAGSLGIGASLNAGHTYAVAQAQHGSAPDIAGKDIANPSSLIESAAMLLSWLEERGAGANFAAAGQAIVRAVDATIAVPAAAHPRPRRAARHQGLHRARRGGPERGGTGDARTTPGDPSSGA